MITKPNYYTHYTLVLYANCIEGEKQP